MYSTIKPYRIDTSVLLTVSVRSTFITTYVQGHLPRPNGDVGYYSMWLMFELYKS